MKKLIIGAMALALTAGVNANDTPTAGGTGASGIGSLTASLTALGISAAVAAAIISNSKGATLPDTVTEEQLKCNEGDEGPVEGVCTTTTITTTVTGTGTNTSTITVPVTSTYPATIVTSN